ncbi:MAG: saccharopine dehydrogenase NADP-binding domain-containing protein [Acidobacteriota bacterium]
MPETRDFDVVLFGATGFTGALTAERLARASAERPLRWAIAGRSREKLEKVAADLEGLGAEGRPPEIRVASADDAGALRALAASTRVIATTVGPYDRYGEPLVAAAVEEKTDYVDITGEPRFVARMLRTYDSRARDAGLRIVNCCGFDSVPHDLGALLTVRQLPSDEGLRVEGVVHGIGQLSGGTWHSAIQAFASWRQSAKAVSRVRARRGRRVRGSWRGVHYEKKVGAWAAPLQTIDPWIVLRTAGALEEYGPDFRYGHFVRVRSLPRVAAGAAALGGVFALAQTGPTRRLLYSLRKPGEGPDAERRALSRFEVVFLGRSEGGSFVRVEVSGGDPGYGETSKMLAESALCLVHERPRLPERCGVVTPAMAFDDVLIERLRAAGMRFEVMG